MKTLVRICYVALFFAFANVPLKGKAQLSLDSYFNVDWQFNIPLGNNFSNDVSGWGMNFEGGYYVTTNIAVGGFINFHTNTCGPCKKMEKTVFPTTECGEYVNERFIPIMLDGEDDGVGTSIAKKYQIFIYPTYLILTPDGRKEGEISGAEFDINKFLDMLRTIMHEL